MTAGLTHERRPRQKLHYIGLAASLLIVAMPTAAQSGSIGAGILGAFLGALVNAANVDAAKKSWEEVDPSVQNCLISQYRISPDQLVRNGVAANDDRVVGYVVACRRTVEAARLEQQQRDEAVHAQEQAAEDARMAQEAADRQAKKAQKLALAAAKAEQEARLQQLTAKYGADIAKAIILGDLRSGMTKDQVREARGNPDRKEVIPPSDELWSYGSERVVFANGRVTHIGH